MRFKTGVDGEWVIVYKATTRLEIRAVEALFAIVQKFVNYNVDLISIDSIGEYDLTKRNLIYLGTGIGIEASGHRDGYRISVREKNSDGMQTIYISNDDSAGMLYAVYDFERYYINKTRYSGRITDKYFKPFIDDMPVFERVSYPKIENRGYWTWGYVICDWRQYIDKMARQKLNTLVMWNDRVPINAEEIIDYAHSCGVRVIFGCSCGYGVTVDPSDPVEIQKWADSMLELYRDEYSKLDIDGIYFQSFTERHDLEINGIKIAKLAADWINSTCAPLLAEYPQLQIYFGIHATSIRSNYTELAAVDSRIHIVWEDAGAFPFNYIPNEVSDYDDTNDYNKQLLELRGKDEKYGAVMKGFTVLNWDQFVHHDLVAVGVRDEEYINKIYSDRLFKWKYFNSYYTTQADKLAESLSIIAKADTKSKLVTFLAEDGLLERVTPACVVLASELMWDPDVDTAELLRTIEQSWDVTL
ncbi:MAG: hypothetical protein HFE63_06700 [Clostridiales bacterium]|nr:hypothetical protein [Clostridiales bacterium]